MKETTGGSLARFAVRQGVLVNVLFVVCLVAGLYASRNVAVDAYPNVDLDAAAIYTVWIGASPAEIDNLVTARIEDELDVPTFLRRGGHAEDDEDAEQPAFLRRSAD